MKDDPILFFRMAPRLVCFLVIVAGIFMAIHLAKIIPAKQGGVVGENGSQRLYATFIIFGILAHAFVLSASFAFFALSHSS